MPLRIPLSRLRSRLSLWCGLWALMAALSCPHALAEREHIVHFPNTAYELNIYKIHGKRPGKTLMLIGGIQGNEPGGFLSADLYADMRLEKGNLIVVPRANFHSIILNQRGVHGDMNRKFTPEENGDSMEDKIVNILKKLISESDCLLNLHDGAGYYYPEYLNRWRNPLRFGQAIITDCEDYAVPGQDRVIHLGRMARAVIDEVNPHIQNDLYKFRYMNTRTDDKESPHREQQRSATYYALTEHRIPAFGVETSKFLPSVDLKVRYHNLVINAFKRLFDIIPESPGLVLDAPVLKYLVLSINGQTPIVLRDRETLAVVSGDAIEVSHIEANYERGLSLDILGYGDLNDYRKAFQIFRDTTIIARKDNHIFAEIPVRVTEARPEKVESKPPPAPQPAAGQERREPAKVDYFVIEAKGLRLLMADGETLHLTKGDAMKIVDVFPPGMSGLEVNFKGFVGNWKNNTGEDRGYRIDTGTALMTRYSLNNQGRIYEILASRGEAVLGRILVELAPPKLDHLVLGVNGHEHVLLKPGEAIALSPEDTLSLEEIRTNLHSQKGIHLHIGGHRVGPGEKVRLGELPGDQGSPRRPMDARKGPLLLGRFFVDLR